MIYEIEKPYEISDLEGAFLVYACTNISGLNRQIKTDGETLGILTNVADNPGHSNREIHVPESGTLVYYMGASNLQTIAGAVVQKGWPADTPVLLVYNVSGKDQEEYYTTLQKTIDQPNQYKTPLIIIIGEVVRLKSKYDIFDIQSELNEHLAVLNT